MLEKLRKVEEILPLKFIKEEFSTNYFLIVENNKKKEIER